MSKLRDLQAQDDDELEVDMSPMIDMVFLLLIFFIVAAKIIKLKQDPDIIPPLARQGSLDQDNIQGRIVVNIYKDGVIANADGRDESKNLLDSVEAIQEYISERAEIIKNKEGGYPPEIHLRGDRDVEFRHVRKVVKGAAAAGVIKVVFASTERYVKRKTPTN